MFFAAQYSYFFQKHQSISYENVCLKRYFNICEAEHCLITLSYTPLSCAQRRMKAFFFSGMLRLQHLLRFALRTFGFCNLSGVRVNNER